METLCDRCWSYFWRLLGAESLPSDTHTALNENEFLNSPDFLLLQLQCQTECHAPNDQRWGIMRPLAAGPNETSGHTNKHSSCPSLCFPACIGYFTHIQHYFLDWEPGSGSMFMQCSPVTPYNIPIHPLSSWEMTLIEGNDMDVSSVEKVL